MQRKTKDTIKQLANLVDKSEAQGYLSKEEAAHSKHLLGQLAKESTSKSRIVYIIRGLQLISAILSILDKWPW